MALQCRNNHSLSESQLRHEIVNHSAGEIVNSNGFSTNAIECKWSMIERWIRHKMSGILPAHSDRTKWSWLIDEFQARSMLKALASHSCDKGNMHVVRFHDVVKLFQVA